MYTLHTINHVTGEEQIREFFNFTDAHDQWMKEKAIVRKHYGNLKEYMKNRTIKYCADEIGSILESDYMDIYLEPCEE